MIGANGAGKTTTMHRHLRPGSRRRRAASPWTAGAHEDPAPQDRQAWPGLVPEGRRVFAQQTVEENLILGATTARTRETPRTSRMSTRPSRLQGEAAPGGGHTSGGEQQMLPRGRALMAKPSSILLLDEPSMGLSPLLVSEIFQIIEEINK